MESEKGARGLLDIRGRTEDAGLNPECSYARGCVVVSRAEPKAGEADSGCKACPGLGGHRAKAKAESERDEFRDLLQALVTKACSRGRCFFCDMSLPRPRDCLHMPDCPVAKAEQFLAAGGA